MVEHGECTDDTECALERGRDGRFYVMRILPQFKAQQTQDPLQSPVGHCAQDRRVGVLLVVSGVISKCRSHWWFQHTGSFEKYVWPAPL